MRTTIFLLLLLAASLIQGRTVSKGLFQNTVVVNELIKDM
jgi:hypothetical protein